MSTEITLERVREICSRYGMLKKGDKVVAAVSGGCDSSVLLHILCSLKDEMDLEILCAHVNHNLRGEESDSDEAFVRDICSKYGIKCEVLSANVAGYADEHRLSTEEAGRKLRYKFFEQCANSLSTDAKIATAHSLSDCEETFVFNAARGASLSGICGVPPKRGRIIRPLIEFSRSEIENYAFEHGVLCVTDSSNLTDEYTRNKIRHSVIPVLKEINPSFDKAFLRLMRNLSETKEHIEKEAKALLEHAKTEEGYDGEILSTADAAVKNRAAALMLEGFGFALDNERTLRISEKFGKTNFKEELSKDSYLVQENSVITKKEKPKQKELTETELSPETELDLGEKIAKIEVLPPKTVRNLHKINGLSLKDTFDYDKIVGKAVLRSRKTGDKADIHGGTKTLKKLFIEEKIPAEERSSVAVIADEHGVLWVENLGAASRARFSENTLNAAVVKIRPKIEN